MDQRPRRAGAAGARRDLRAAAGRGEPPARGFSPAIRRPEDVTGLASGLAWATGDMVVRLPGGVTRLVD